jgi:hypothetical protein
MTYVSLKPILDGSDIPVLLLKSDTSTFKLSQQTVETYNNRRKLIEGNTFILKSDMIYKCQCSDDDYRSSKNFRTDRLLNEIYHEFCQKGMPFLKGVNQTNSDISIEYIEYDLYLRDCLIIGNDLEEQLWYVDCDNYIVYK